MNGIKKANIAVNIKIRGEFRVELGLDYSHEIKASNLKERKSKVERVGYNEALRTFVNNFKMRRVELDKSDHHFGTEKR